MTIERARQILGDDIADLSDEKVGEILKCANSLCSALLDIVLNDIVKCEPARIPKYYGQDSGNLRSGK